MESQGPNVPDLATVLKTLSAYAPAQSAITDASAPERSSVSHSCRASPNNLAQSTVESSIAQQPPASASRNKDNPPDPAVITAWPAALKCVMRTVAQNEAIQSKIRRLIQSQQDHERRWWQGREALLAKQNMRAEKKRNLDEVLRSVGGSVAAGADVTTAEDDLLEVSNYDKKVHKALSGMAGKVDSELRGLGIPFFAIRHELVVPANDDHEQSGLVNETSKITISADELGSLQKKMLNLLEDMCKE